MADTVRTRAAILALLADNTSGDISPQDVRDAFVTVHGVFGGWYISSTINLTEDTTPTAFAGASNLTAFTTSYDVTVNTTAGTLTVGTTGVYAAHFYCAVMPSGPHDMNFYIYKGGTVVSSHGTDFSVTDAVYNHVSFSLILDLTASDALDVRHNITASSASFTYSNGAFWIQRLA